MLVAHHGCRPRSAATARKRALPRRTIRSGSSSRCRSRAPDQQVDRHPPTSKAWKESTPPLKVRRYADRGGAAAPRGQLAAPGRVDSAGPSPTTRRRSRRSRRPAAPPLGQRGADSRTRSASSARAAPLANPRPRHQVEVVEANRQRDPVDVRDDLVVRPSRSIRGVPTWTRSVMPRAAYPGLMTSLMSASRSSNGRNALFIALMVNHWKSAQAVAERLDQQRDLPRHRGAAHQPVVGVDRDPEAQAGAAARSGARRSRRPRRSARWRTGTSPAGCACPGRRRRAGPGAVPSAADRCRRRSARRGRAGRRRTTGWPARSTGSPKRLAGVDGEVEVLPLEVLEGVQVPGRRVARLRAGDVEARPRPASR